MIACSDCDLLHRGAALGEQPAFCARCGAPFARLTSRASKAPIAYVIGCLVLLIAANVFPFMTFDVSGRVETSYLFSGVTGLADQGFYALAVLVLLATIVVPFLRLYGFLYLADATKHRHTLRRWIELFKPWAMLDVYALGVLVAIVKLSQDAEVGVGHGFYGFCCFVILSLVTKRAIEATPREESTR